VGFYTVRYNELLSGVSEVIEFGLGGYSNIHPDYHNQSNTHPKNMTENSNVRHPRCVLYSSKELGILTLTVEHNYIYL